MQKIKSTQKYIIAKIEFVIRWLSKHKEIPTAH